MSDSCATNEYFSGQGSVLIATKHTTTGEPEGFVPVGNVSALTLGVETTEFEHKESCSGTRGVDKVMVQEVKVSFAMTLESLNKENMALTMYGTATEVAGASVSDEQIIAAHDMWTRLGNIKVSSVIVGDDATPTTTYTLDTDYELNAEAGSIKVLSTGAIADLASIFIDYTFETHDNIEGVTSSAAPERWVRFEGMNTADTDKPVVIDIYKMSIKPLAELALINEELSEMAVEGSALSDTTRASGSKYYTVKKIK